MPTSNRWRLHVTANNGRSAINIAELEMRIALGGADQCTGGTASASSEWDGSGTWSAAKAFDDDPATFWSGASGAIPGWIEYQFGSAIEILEYTIQARADVTDGAPKDWKLEFYDGSSWQEYHSVTGETAWGLSEIRTFTPVSGATRSTQLVTETLHQATDPALRSTQLAVETLHQAANPSLRLTQLVVESLVSNPSARVTQGTLETLVSPTPDARISQSTMEVLAAGFPDVWISQAALEVLIGLAPESENVCWIAIPIGIAMHKPIGRRI